MNNTFGRSPAAQELDRLLEKNPSARRKVSTLISQYTDKLLNISSIKDVPTALLCMSMLRDRTLERMDKKVNVSPEVVSYTKNVITAKYRVYAESYKFVSSFLAKKK